MLIAILAVFALCWCPLQITILYSEYRGNHTEPVSLTKQITVYQTTISVHYKGNTF